MSIVTVSGQAFSYTDRGSGQPLVLLHAFPAYSAMWSAQIAAFSKNHRVIAPDFPGFGGSSPFHRAPSIEAMAQDIEALLTRINVSGPVALCGLSMGGYVAFSFARLFPQRLRALILADTRADGDSAEAKAKRDERIAYARSHTADEFVRGMVANLTNTPSGHPAHDRIVEMGRAQAPGSIIGALQALRDRPDASLWLHEIKVPTLVIVGKQDTLTPPSMAEAIVKGISGAQLVEIEGAGHYTNMDRVGEFNEAVATFLDSQVGLR